VKYLILIYGNPATQEIWEGLSEAQRSDALGGYVALNRDLDASGESIVHEALADPSLTKRVSVSDGRTMTTDGPFAEVKEHLAGFYLLDCETIERANRARRADTGSRLRPGRGAPDPGPQRVRAVGPLDLPGAGSARETVRCPGIFPVQNAGSRANRRGVAATAERPSSRSRSRQADGVRLSAPWSCELRPVPKRHYGSNRHRKAPTGRRVTDRRVIRPAQRLMRSAR
jgi:hypothetical protein